MSIKKHRGIAKKIFFSGESKQEGMDMKRLPYHLKGVDHIWRLLMELGVLQAFMGIETFSPAWPAAWIRKR
jgi:hypothetical protein